jgi:cyanate permease
MATPLLIGYLRDLTHNFVAGLFFLAAMLVASGVLVLLTVRD